MNEWILVLLLTAFGYLCGSSMNALWIGRIFGNVDIGALGHDHNPGTSNVFKLCGFIPGLLCLFLDLFKGTLPVHMAYSLLPFTHPGWMLILAAPVVGHAWPIYRCRGGKAIAVSFGVFIGLIPRWRYVLTLCVIYIFFSLVWKIHPNERRTVVTFAFAALTAMSGFVLGMIPPGICFGCLSIASVVISKNLHDAFGVSGSEPDEGSADQVR